MFVARSPDSNNSSHFFDIPLFRRPCRYRFRDIRHFAYTFSLLKLFPLREQSFAQNNTEMDRATTGHASFPYSVCFIKV